MRRELLHGDSGLHTPADCASPFEHTRAPCARSELGSCSSADEGLAQPSEAADAAERSERACRCYRRTRSSTLDGRGHQGVGCSCVAAVDMVRRLCAASQLRASWSGGHRGMAVWPFPGRLGCLVPDWTL